MKFLSRKYLVAGLAQGTAQILERVVAADPEQALEFIVDNLKEDRYLFEAETLEGILLSVQLTVAVAVDIRPPRRCAILYRLRGAVPRQTTTQATWQVLEGSNDTVPAATIGEHPEHRTSAVTWGLTRDAIVVAVEAVDVLAGVFERP
jgi:hypothetical protein